jgi:diketogulonate reductase-like aldo/keto reductase
MMSQRTAGGAPVHPIGIGTWDMGGGRHEDGTVFADYRHDGREVAAIRHSLANGQNHIDTAQLYGAGHTEEIVGKALQDIPRESIYLASKIWSSHLLRHAVVRQVQDMLKRLGTEYLDLLYVHAPWDIVPMAEYVCGMNDALEMGLVRALGVSNFNLEQLRKAIEISSSPIVANQLLYNIVDRGMVTDEHMRFAEENAIAIVAYRPVERKMLADNTENETVLGIAAKYNRPVSQIAINWLIGQKAVVTIPKASSPSHIEENLGALEFELSSADRAVLDGVAGSTQESVFGG